MIGDLSDIQHLASDPALAPFLKEGVPVVIWSMDGTQVIWASRAGAPLLDALAPEGVVISKEFSQNLAILAREPSQKHLGSFSTSIRLQRVRLPQMGTANTGDVLTCACHVLKLPNGDHGLLTAVIGRLPERLLQNVYEAPQVPRAHKSEHSDHLNADYNEQTHEFISDSDKTDRDAHSIETTITGQETHYTIASDIEHIKEKLKERAQIRPRRRFVWETDSNGRFIVISEDLTEAIGILPEACIGKNWFDLIGDKFKDPNGDIVNALSQTRTWSVRNVPWRVEGTDIFVNVDMSAVPLSNENGEFSGFRGFGICHLDSAFANQMKQEVKNKIDDEEIKYTQEYVDPEHNESLINNDQWSEEAHDEGNANIKSVDTREIPEHMWVMWSEDAQGPYHTQTELVDSESYKPIMRLEQGGHFFHPFLTTMSPTSRQMALGQSDHGSFSYASVLRRNQAEAALAENLEHDFNDDTSYNDQLAKESTQFETDTRIDPNVSDGAAYAPQAKSTSIPFTPSFSPQTTSAPSSLENVQDEQRDVADDASADDASADVSAQVPGEQLNNMNESPPQNADASEFKDAPQSTPFGTSIGSSQPEIPAGYTTFIPVKLPKQAARLINESSALSPDETLNLAEQKRFAPAPQEHANQPNTHVRERERVGAYAGVAAGKFMEEVVVSVDFEDQVHDFTALDEFAGANVFPSYEQEHLAHHAEEDVALTTSEIAADEIVTPHIPAQPDVPLENAPLEPVIPHFAFNPPPTTPTRFEPVIPNQNDILENDNIAKSFENTSESLKYSQMGDEQSAGLAHQTTDRELPDHKDTTSDSITNHHSDFTDDHVINSPQENPVEEENPIEEEKHSEDKNSVEINPDRSLAEFYEEKVRAQEILERSTQQRPVQEPPMRMPTFILPASAEKIPAPTIAQQASIEADTRRVEMQAATSTPSPRAIKARRSTAKLNQDEREAFREIARLLKKTQEDKTQEVNQKAALQETTIQEAQSSAKELENKAHPPMSADLNPEQVHVSTDEMQANLLENTAHSEDEAAITPQLIADHMMRDLSATLDEAAAIETEKAANDQDTINSTGNITPLPASPSNRLPRPKMVSDYDPGFAAILNRLPMGVVVLRGDDCLYANQTFLDLVGYNSIHAINALGGLDHLFTGRPADDFDPEEAEGNKPLEVISAHGDRVALDAALSSIYWQGKRATLLSFRRLRPVLHDLARLKALELDYKQEQLRVHELSAILDTATDGVIVLDEKSRILSMNRSAEALFGYDQKEIVGEVYTTLLAGESHALALDYMEGLINHGVASLLNDGREVIGRVRQGGHIPLFITIGSLNHETTSSGERRFCAVMRDLTTWKKAEKELIEAKQHAEETSSHKSEFLAKISHEIRTPLNAILGFTEVMRDGRFGAIENERYRDYINDIHTSGQHVISLVNDLLDLAKIEAGKADLTFAATDVNAMLEMAVALLHPQAVQEHVVVRMSLAPKIPMVVADERSLKQIAINLLSNAIKFTPEGGQVIVSSEFTEQGEVVMRFRDTGIGMNGADIKAALEPFRQVATSRRSGGTGLGLPLTKALTEANRGAFSLTSEKGHGTLVEITFPMTRVLAS